MKIGKGSNVLATGGAGFIGSHLTDQLMSMGCNVRVFDNLSNGKQINIAHHLGKSGFEFVRGSVTDPSDVERALADVDTVFHLACLGVRHSIVHPFENHRVNAEGTLLLLDAAFRAKIKKFLYCSSSEVYGTAEYIPMPESHPTRPCTIYGSSKLAGEAYARAYYKTYDMPVVIVRPFNTFGPRSHHEGDAGEMIPKSIVRALNNQPIMIFGDGGQTRDFTYVADTASALIRAMECDEMMGQTLNVGSSFEISIKALAGKILQKIPESTSDISLSPSRPGDVLRLYSDCSRFQTISSWRPVHDFDVGLEKTIDFFRNHPAGVRAIVSEESGRSWESSIK